MLVFCLFFHVRVLPHFLFLNLLSAIYNLTAFHFPLKVNRAWLLLQPDSFCLFADKTLNRNTNPGTLRESKGNTNWLFSYLQS